MLFLTVSESVFKRTLPVAPKSKMLKCAIYYGFASYIHLERLIFRAIIYRVVHVPDLEKSRKTETLATGDVVDLLDSLNVDNGIKGEIVKMEPKSIYTITDLKDFKEFLKVPLNDEETKYEGRWECKDLGFWLIQRKDRTYTMLEVLQAGDEIEGKFVRRLEHGIWGIKDRKLLYRELLIRDGELIPPVFWRMFPEEITSFGVDKITFSEREISYQKGLEGEIIKGKYVPPPQIRVQQFQEPEMKPYNDKAALEGFDIIKAMEKAKR